MVTDVTREKVTAIVVCHGRDLSFLGATLSGLSAQTHQPDRIVVLIPNHDSEAVQPIHEHLEPGSDAVSLVTSNAENLGQMIRYIDAGELGGADWLWFLHADSAPEPRALDALLRRGETSKRIAVVGPKQIAWNDDEAPVVLEVGIRATRSARRVPEIEEGERDQGQYDSRTDVLAVGTAGMLVRRAVWDKLGGLDPQLGPFGDGLEFSRRARRAGYRVVVEPKAAVRHARVGLGEADSTYARRRAAQLYNALLAAPGALVPAIAVFYLVAAPFRALARLVFKEHVLAWAEVKATVLLVASLGAVVKGRRRIAKVAQVGPEALAGLEARPAEIRLARKESRRSKKEAKMLAEQPDPLTMKARADLARHTRRGAALTLALGTAFTVVFHLPVFSSGVLSGGGLAADATVGSELAAIAWSGWLDSGDGYPLPLDPLWVAAIPIVMLGQPFGLTLGGFATAILYLAIPAAAGFAYLGAGRLTRSWVARSVLAALWMVAPSFLDALHTGQIGAVVAHVLLPLGVYAVVGAWRGSAAALGLAALTFGLLAAAAPIYLVATTILAASGLLFNRRRKRWLWLVVPALLAIVPTLRAHPDPLLFFAQTGVPIGSQSAHSMVDSLSADLLAWLPIAVIAGAGVLALLRLHRMWWIRAGWVIVAAGIVHAVFAQFANVGVRRIPGGYESVDASPHVGLTIAWFGLWLALGCATHALRTAMRRRNFGATHIIGGLAMVAVPIATIAIGGRALWQTTDPVLGDNAPDVPALAEEAFQNNERVLTLVMSSDGVGVELWRGNGQELHEYTMARGLSQARALESGAPFWNDEAGQDLAQLASGLLTGSQDAASGLGEHAVSVVLVPALEQGESAEFRAQLVGRIQSAPGLQYVSDTEVGTFWRVSEPSSRAYTTEANTHAGVINAKVEVSGEPSERELRLAERANAHWSAHIDGLELGVSTGGDPAWYQAWTVPANMAGTVEITYDDPVHKVLGAAGGLSLIASAIIALPLRRRKGGVE
ncbi:GT2 family glycosyltransferase [Trueperella bonasi]|uniref:GT2 family glycosyltransferase n=1 Tax=Trueperella bonasi TaxID=312286 RepID=A0ABT9NEZ8_9ACTO|nr:glycosyltransferase [Trueperella bonasi]MDP9805970.1 GT2 family glycosyltransferase [Trueperella bonasi]